MRKLILFAVYFIYSFSAKAQVQFAGTNTVNSFVVNSNGQFGEIHSYPSNYPSQFSPVVQGSDNKLYFIFQNDKVGYINVDGSGYTIFATLPTPAHNNVCLGFDGKLYFSTQNNKIYSLYTDGTSITYLVDAPASVKLTADADGWLYGVSLSTPNILYRVRTDGSNYEILHDFNTATEGSASSSGVGICLTPNNRIFGLMNQDGPSGFGCLYSIQKDGTDFQVHYDFSDLVNGRVPVGELAYQNGKIFMVNGDEGVYGYGTICSIDTNGNNYTKIYDFGDLTKPAIGDYQTRGLTPGHNGKLYGCTSSYSAFNGSASSLYSISEDGSTLTILHSPDPSSLYYYESLSTTPILLNDNYTLLFNSGSHGMNEAGFIYSIGIDGLNGHPIYDYGYLPGGSSVANSGLIKVGMSTLYGVTNYGGLGGGGTIFRQNADGSGYTILHHFTGTLARSPHGKLLLASDGKLYGVCSAGGNPANIYNAGVIYRINTDGSDFAIIKQFNIAGSGTLPMGGLVEGPGGELYGITDRNYPTFNEAVIYKINKDGSAFTVLKIFPSSGIEGYHPHDGLTLFGNYLYGVFQGGGSGFNGTIFRIQMNGTDFQVLRQFYFSNNDGAAPGCGLVVANNNRLYGLNSFGGENGAGTLYSMLSDGSDFQVHHHFDFNTTGFLAEGRLVQASDGLLYGTTLLDGPAGGGTFFSYNPSNSNFAVLYNFQPNRQGSYSELVEIPFNATLPIRLNNFIAQKQNNYVALNWNTDQENNSDKFVVQRSSNGKDFTVIAVVEANGNSSERKSYSCNDLMPVNGKNYYRLKMVDKNNLFEYSSIRLVDFSKKGDYISLYPNPARESILMESSLTGKNLAITIIDTEGKTVLKKTIPNEAIIKIDIQAFRKGVYFVTASDGKNSLKGKIIKQ